MRKIIKILGLVGFVICLVIMYTTDHGIPGIQKYDPDFQLLDMQFHYDAQVVHDTLEKIDNPGREAYHNYLLLDFAFILCFLVMMLTITDKVFLYSRAKTIFLSICIFRAVLDILENCFLLIILNSFPIFNYMLATMCSWATTLKFVALYAWVLAIIIQFIKAAYNKSRRMS